MLGALFAVGLLVAPHSTHRLRRDFAGLGIWGPLAVIAVNAVLTCAFVPTPILSGASGLLFGTALGTPVAIASATLGASLAFLIARPLTRKPYGRVIRGRLRTFTLRIEARGFLTVLYARIAPGAPFALTSYAAGMLRIRMRDFAAATALGASPRAFAYAALGGTLNNYSSAQALIAIGVLVAIAIGGAILIWRARARTRRAHPRGSQGSPSQPEPAPAEI